MILKFIFAAMKAGAPLLFGTVGEIVTEKSGHLNLGVEGMMCVGAFAGFYVAYRTSSATLAVAAAFFGGLLAALIYAVLTVTFRANQNVTGLALTIFGTGFANMLGDTMIANAPGNIVVLSAELNAQPASLNIFGLGSTDAGRILFGHNPLLYLGVAIAIGAYVYLRRTKTGLNVRAVGENPAAADAAGINVSGVKYANILLGGGICGLGGGYISLIVGGGVWNNNCVGGTGWIAVALVIFASWGTLKAILGSLLFGGFSILQFYVSKDVISLPNAFFVMLPFICTILVLIITSMKKSREHSQPESCGVNYFREER